MEEKTYHLIENYLEGKLSKAEVAAFETRLEKDAVFAQKVSLFKELEASLGDPVRQNIRGQLAVLGAKYFQQPVLAKKKIKRLPFYRRSWVMAASFLLLVSLGVLLWQNQSIASLSNEQIFAQNYQVPKMDRMTRGTEATTAMQAAIQLYKNEDYSNALISLKDLSQTNPENQQLVYLLAHTYLNLSPPQLTEASKAFKALIEHQQNVYVPKAQWYLSLIYIQQNNTEAAIPLLQSVIEAGDSNQTRAKEILNQLN